MTGTTKQVREAQREDVLRRLLRAATIHRDARELRDSLIREAVRLGVSQTRVANVAGINQASVSRLVSHRRVAPARSGRRSRTTTGAGGGTL